MEGIVRRVVKGVNVFITSQDGNDCYGHKSQFVFDHGHRCIQEGMELGFVSRPNPYKVGQQLAHSIRTKNWNYPSKQIVSTVAKWSGKFGHAELACGCRVLLLRPNILTLPHWIDRYMKVGAQIVFDIDETKREGTDVVSLMAVNIEIIDTSSSQEIKT